MSKVIVDWGTNWSDEIDYVGSAIFDKDELEILKQKIKSLKKPFMLRLGIEQYVDYRNGEELLNEISERPIDDDSAKAIEKYIGISWGHFYCFDQVDDWVKEQNEHTN